MEGYPPPAPVLGDVPADGDMLGQAPARLQQHGPGKAGYFTSPEPRLEAQQDNHRIALGVTAISNVRNQAAHVIRFQYSRWLSAHSFYRSLAPTKVLAPLT
jgi:hypothetical protein